MDPIGVGPDGPKDEYDCLLWPVMRQLEADASPEELCGFLAAELEEHFGHGGDAEGIASFVAQARAWFDASWKGTQFRLSGSAVEQKQTAEHPQPSLSQRSNSKRTRLRML